MNNERQIYHYHGYFEDVTDLATGKVLGTRTVEAQPERKCGYHGQREETVVSPLTLQRGHKTATFAASPAKPLRIRTTLYPICGRMIYEVHPTPSAA